MFEDMRSALLRAEYHLLTDTQWHAGLPLESLLTASESLDIRGWEFGDIVGLDLSGRTRTGRRWRWLGAPVSDAISYENAEPQQAEYFDEILKSVCFSGR
jgi:hypothetical protein